MRASTYEVALPLSWQDSVVVKHIASPYSPQALAEPRKDWIEVAPYDIRNFSPASPVPFPLLPIKRSGEELDVSEQRPEYIEAHLIFMSAAKFILGSNYLHSQVFFDHFSSHLHPGEVHTFSQPHMDGTMPGGVNLEQILTAGSNDLELKLVGTIMSDVPTVILQGCVEADDFEGETLTHLRRSVQLQKAFVQEQLPLNTLIIMAPSTIHYAQQAAHEVDMRHFMRWQAFA